MTIIESIKLDINGTVSTTYGFIDLKASFIIEFTASFLQEKDKNSLKERLIRI